MKYIERERAAYKANLHCHTVLSDGKLKPEQVVEAYKNQGYSILAITDHEAPYDHSGLSTEDFLVLTGYEAYIRTSADCKYDNFKPEIHMNLLAREPHNTTFVAYDPYYCKYMPKEIADTRKKAGDLGPRTYSREYINRFIREARAAGYLVTYNHPCWSMEAEEDILSYEGIFSLEVFNAGSMLVNGYEHNMALYDKFLRLGKMIYCHGSDDNHNKHPFDDILCDSFGAWTMIMAKELTYEAVISALEKGDFYASTGPEIYELTMEDGCVHLECSPARIILMHLSPKKVFAVYNPDGSPVTEGDFKVPDGTQYIYFSVITEHGKSAHTRGFRQEEFLG